MDPPSFDDKSRWHELAGQAFECVSFVPKDSHVEIRSGRPVVIRSKRKPPLVRPTPPRSRKPRP